MGLDQPALEPEPEEREVQKQLVDQSLEDAADDSQDLDDEKLKLSTERSGIDGDEVDKEPTNDAVSKETGDLNSDEELPSTDPPQETIRENGEDEPKEVCEDSDLDEDGPQPQESGIEHEIALSEESSRAGVTLFRRGTGLFTRIRHRLVESRQRLRLSASASGHGDTGEMLIGDDEEESSSSGHDGTNSNSDVAAWQVVDREGDVVAEETAVDSSLLGGSIEVKMERMLTWMLTPAIHGIPKLGVLAAEERAQELLALHHRDVESAVREVVAGSERTVSTLVLTFCLERIPVVGCPTVLLRTTWGNMRSILIIASLYSHDLESPRVQHEALLCLIPPGDDKDRAASTALKQQDAGTPALVANTTQQVARMMIRGALRRATGLQAAVDCFELASLLYSSCGSDDTDEDGFVHVMATPASAAQEFFRKKSFASSAILWCSLPLLVLGMASPSLWSMFRWLPSVLSVIQFFLERLPSRYFSWGTTLLIFLIGPCFALRAYTRSSRVQKPRRTFLNFFSQKVPEKRWARWKNALEEIWPQIVTTMVFLLHALLPALSTSSALSVVSGAISPTASDGSYGWDGWDLLNRLACAALGSFSFFSVLVHQMQAEYEAEQEEAPQHVKAFAKIASLSQTAAQACCFLSAWVYFMIALDMVLDSVWQWLAFLFSIGVVQDAMAIPVRGTPLGFTDLLASILGAEPYTNPLNCEKSVTFLLNVICVISQQRLVELLSRREVLLRMIGAERAMASTICLLCKGVAVACAPSSSSNPIADFLNSVAPHHYCCVAIVAIRSQAVLLGAAFVLAPRLTTVLGSTICFYLGLIFGAYVANTVLSVWYVNRADLDSAALRLAMLVPGGISNQAKGLLRGALAGARTRAVQLMAKGLLERVMRWWCARWI
eukprot:TRINITY_DN93581_c0_g1_i1.p1 TRINITY_DN93581_c0_g1~~TRINITY_DN93581_c0_g1_i1.p1  ORF type:complete len:893 (+),score=140.86 TRINITY_DN93581_c0_g1_i1:129-2807(+)